MALKLVDIAKMAGADFINFNYLKLINLLSKMLKKLIIKA